MKILIISPTPTHPPIAGNRVRILALANSLMAAGHDVHFAWVTMECGDVAGMRAFFNDRLEVIPYNAPSRVKGRIHRMRRRLLRLAGSHQAYVWGVDEWYDSAISDAVEALCARLPFDVVFVEYVFLSRALEAVPESVIKIIDTHDSFADRHLQYLQAGRQPEWFSTTQAGECAGLSRADVVIAIQDGEAKLFDQLLGGRVVVTRVGHLLDVGHVITPSAEPKAVFIASANSINVDAATYFIESVLPLVREHQPDFQMFLAGDVCERTPDAAGVRKLGRVESVADAYSLGALAINPVRMGTGLNIKTAECLALGVPLVVTESGSRGLEWLRGKAFVSVPNDDPVAMASAIVGILRDRRVAETMAREARKAAFEWNAVQLGNLVSILEKRHSDGAVCRCTLEAMPESER